MASQETGEGLAGELATLVGVEDLWRSLAQRFLQCLDTEIGVQGVGFQHPGADRAHAEGTPVNIDSTTSIS